VSTFCSLTTTDATFLPGHSAAIKVNIGGKNHTIGVFGILHPDILRKERFDLGYPVSTLEINLEVFL
jgi:phenylalanyl-tRNA synthetase beta chain